MMKLRLLLCSLLLSGVGFFSAAPADSASFFDGFGFVYDGRIVDAVEFFTPHDGGNGRSCATCHRPERAYADGLARASGVGEWSATTSVR